MLIRADKRVASVPCVCVFSPERQWVPPSALPGMAAYLDQLFMSWHWAHQVERYAEFTQGKLPHKGHWPFPLFHSAICIGPYLLDILRWGGFFLICWRTLMSWNKELRDACQCSLLHVFLFYLPTEMEAAVSSPAEPGPVPAGSAAHIWTSHLSQRHTAVER